MLREGLDRKIQSTIDRSEFKFSTLKAAIHASRSLSVATPAEPRGEKIILFSGNFWAVNEKLLESASEIFLSGLRGA